MADTYFQIGSGGLGLRTLITNGSWEILDGSISETFDESGQVFNCTLTKVRWSVRHILLQHLLGGVRTDGTRYVPTRWDLAVSDGNTIWDKAYCTTAQITEMVANQNQSNTDYPSVYEPQYANIECEFRVPSWRFVKQFKSTTPTGNHYMMTERLDTATKIVSTEKSGLYWHDKTPVSSPPSKLIRTAVWNITLHWVTDTDGTTLSNLLSLVGKVNRSGSERSGNLSRKFGLVFDNYTLLMHAPVIHELVSTFGETYYDIDLKLAWQPIKSVTAMDSASGWNCFSRLLPTTNSPPTPPSKDEAETYIDSPIYNKKDHNDEDALEIYESADFSKFVPINDNTA